MTQHREPIEMGNQDFRGDVSHSNGELHPSEGNGAEFTKSGGIGAVVVHHTVTTLLVVMVVAVGTWAYLTFKNADANPEGFSIQGPLFETAAGDAQLQRFHFALDVFYTLYGKYPPDLEALADEGLIASSDLDYPPGSSSFIYRRIGETYELGIQRTFTTIEVVEPKAAAGEAAAVSPTAGTEADMGTDTGESP